MSAYNDIDEARESALTTLQAIGARYNSETSEWLSSEVERAYEASESWYDWGESEAGAFWAALASYAQTWKSSAGLSDSDYSKIVAWLAAAGYAVESSERSAEAQSVYSVVSDTVVASATDLNTAGKTVADPKTWIGPAIVAGIILLLVTRK